MAKKRSWFNLVKRLFIWDTHSTQEKKEKRRKWIFGRLKTKKLASITAAPTSKEAEVGQSKHTLTVAIASAANAEEAVVTSAEIASEVVQLIGVSQSAIQHEEDKEEEFQAVKIRNGAPECHWEIKESAAIKIQTAFRGYLAKKALRALKGIVKLQAIIRGRAVRRQAMSTLKCLQSIVSIQSKVCARRRLLQMAEGKLDFIENEEMQDSKDKIIRMDSNSERKWDDSTLLKEEVDACCTTKKEAILKRERIKEYSFNHRRSAESERSKVSGRWRYWLEQWVDTQLSKSKELEDLDSVICSSSRVCEEFGGKQLRLRSIQRQNQVEGLDSPILVSRKSFPPPHRRQCSVGEEQSYSSSPATPAYMAATESARARIRSTSSPKARTWNYDMNSDSYSPCKKKISIVSSSVNSEVLHSGRMVKLSGGSGNQQKSPSFKGLSVPIKSSRIMKDLSINSDCSLPNWDRQSSFK